MQDGVIPLFSGKKVRKHGWSAQELAELYRIESVLVQCGISVEMVMGESDEGEPWFILCSSDTGDVLVHVATIDGTYHIAGGWFPVIRGSSLNQVVHRFMAQQPAFLLGKGDDNVLLHPGSVVIAVLAAICLVSEEYHREALGFAKSNKALRSDSARADQEIFNVADQRQLTLSDFSFSPQQAFVILSAIALSATQFVYKDERAPETIDLALDVIGDVDGVEWDFEVTVTGPWDGAFAAAGQQSLSGQNVVSEIIGREPQQVAPKAVEATDIIMPEDVFANESVFFQENQAFTGTKPPPRSETYNAASNRTEEAASLSRPIVEVVEKRADARQDHVIGLVDRTLNELGYEVQTTDDGLAFSSSDNLPVAVSNSFISFESLAQLAPYLDLFEGEFGDAIIDMRYNRWVVYNDTALDTAYGDDRDAGPDMTLYEFDDATSIYFFGITADMIEFSLIA